MVVTNQYPGGRSRAAQADAATSNVLRWCCEMSGFRCNKWQDHDGVWHYQMVGPGRTRRARRKWQRNEPVKPVAAATHESDPDFKARLGYLAYLFDRGIIQA